MLVLVMTCVVDKRTGSIMGAGGDASVPMYEAITLCAVENVCMARLHTGMVRETALVR